LDHPWQGFEPWVYINKVRAVASSTSGDRLRRAVNPCLTAILILNELQRFFPKSLNASLNLADQCSKVGYVKNLSSRPDAAARVTSHFRFSREFFRKSAASLRPCAGF